MRSGAWGPGQVGRAVGFGRGKRGQLVGVAAQALLAAGPYKIPTGTPAELLVLPLCCPMAVCTAEGGGHQRGMVAPAQPTQTSGVGGTCFPRPTGLGSWDS